MLKLLAWNWIKEVAFNGTHPKNLAQVWSILPALKILPLTGHAAAWQVEGATQIEAKWIKLDPQNHTNFFMAIWTPTYEQNDKGLQK